MLRLATWWVADRATRFIVVRAPVAAGIALMRTSKYFYNDCKTVLTRAAVAELGAGELFADFSRTTPILTPFIFYLFLLFAI